MFKDEAVTSFSRQTTSIIFTQANKIGFLKVLDGELGPVYCKASHDADLVDAQVDYTSAGFVYGLSAKNRELYVFRSSNLLMNPEATDCKFETKF